MDGSEDAGLLAQEVAAVYPELTEDFAHPDLNDGEMVKVINYEALLAAVIEALKEIHTNLLDAGEERLWEQRDKIEVLDRRITALEAGTRRD